MTHRRSQDFQRVDAPRGESRISGWGTMEGPKALSKRGYSMDLGREAPQRRGVGSGRGAVAPPIWESVGIAPRKFLKFNLQICAF